MNEEKLNTVQSLIGVLNSPIAQRQGYSISAENCKIWVEELTKFLEQTGWHPASKPPKEDIDVYAIIEPKEGCFFPGFVKYNKDKKRWEVSDTDVEVGYNVKWWCYPPKE